MKVLVLGGAGFIGSILCPYLRERGDEVAIMDTLLFEERSKRASPQGFIQGDIRSINDLFPPLSKADAVVNLAAISNDPASDLQPQLAWEINYKASELVAQLCQTTAKRVVQASSCSVYGFSDKETFTEESKLGPVTLYAHTKMLSEQHYLHKDVDAIILRLATVYGHSSKPRFDLVVNTMIGSGLFCGKVTVKGGSQWRPIIHVKDVAKAIYLALHAKSPGRRIYNVGSNEQNFQIDALGTHIAEALPDAELVHEEDGRDERSYKVDFSLIEKDLRFEAEFTLADAVSEFQEAYNRGTIRNMDEDVYYRVKHLKKYIGDHELLKKLPNRSYYLPLNVPYEHYNED